MFDSLEKLAYSTHGMVERGIGVCLRIILSVLSIVDPSSNNRIETDLDSWGTTIPVTPAQCSESFNHSCRPSDVRFMGDYHSCHTGTVQWIIQSFM
jgi:hypothetical protein